MYVLYVGFGVRPRRGLTHVSATVQVARAWESAIAITIHQAVYTANSNVKFFAAAFFFKLLVKALFRRITSYS
ncbi:MAG: hypothetical protein V7K77_14545 [Nostoc sp.]|uniref:hypothetical protein n=1 Tax=Nostoc sp. TaxID=1180 RepID=UPI002FF4594D